MPIYEYRCSKCESHFEKMQKISDEPLKVCEKCGGELEKQWSLSGFQFKGAGWYVTDYANKGKSEVKAESKSDGKSSAPSPEAKSETTGASEKTSAGESTARTESASNTSTSNATKPDAPASKKE
jgi:putative FmdB family regulatory protein